MISNCTMALKHLVRSIQLSDMPRGSSPSSSADTSALGAFVGGGSWAFALQDVLRFLSLWFELGHYPDVAACVKRYVDEIRIEHWLLVIPQIIARLDTSHKTVQDGLVELLKRIGAYFFLLSALLSSSLFLFLSPFTFYFLMTCAFVLCAQARSIHRLWSIRWLWQRERRD